MRMLCAGMVCCCLFSVTGLFTACSGEDDQYSLESFYNQYRVIPDTFAIAIAWNGTAATVTGDTDSVSIAISGADVTVTSTSSRYMELTVSGETADGSLLVYSDKAWGLILNGVSITNADGPAINNQCGKALYVTVTDGTTNTLADGTAYADAPINTTGAAIDQKGTLFSEGQVYFNGKGKLTVTGNCKNAIASDDYIVIGATAPAATVPDASPSGLSSGPTIVITANGTNGIKVNDGMEIYGGILTIDVTTDGGRGIRNEARMTIGGGETTITTSGDCLEEILADGSIDYSSCAGIKCDSLFTMTAGTLTISSSGDGGKGINCGQNVEFKGGTLIVQTTGSNDFAKPKGVKSDTGIILSGGSFTVTVEKSWACDNGSDSSDIEGMITILGTPTTQELDKKSVKVIYTTQN